MKNRLPKSERLNSRIKLQKLFASSNFFKIGNIKVYWNTHESNSPICEFVTVVPKKIVSKAVIRNKIKRRIKEAYRLHKNLLNSNHKSLEIAFCYLYEELLDYKSIEEKIKLILQRLNETV